MKHIDSRSVNKLIDFQIYRFMSCLQTEKSHSNSHPPLAYICYTTVIRVVFYLRLIYARETPSFAHALQSAHRLRPVVPGCCMCVIWVFIAAKTSCDK